MTGTRNSAKGTQEGNDTRKIFLRSAWTAERIRLLWWLAGRMTWRGQVREWCRISISISSESHRKANISLNGLDDGPEGKKSIWPADWSSQWKCDQKWQANGRDSIKTLKSFDSRQEDENFFIEKRSTDICRTWRRGVMWESKTDELMLESGATESMETVDGNWLDGWKREMKSSTGGWKWISRLKREAKSAASEWAKEEKAKSNCEPFKAFKG